MSHSQSPAPVELSADPAAMTTRERRRGSRPQRFGELLPEFGELRTVQRDRQPAPPASQPIAADRSEAVLRLITPGHRLRQIRLVIGQALVIGRSGSADLKLRDAALSRTHLKVQLGPNGVVATDLGSTNGSFLRGLGFVHAVLHAGDHVVFGQSVLEVVRIENRARAAA